jgi:hypothetical protein
MLDLHFVDIKEHVVRVKGTSQRCYTVCSLTLCHLNPWQALCARLCSQSIFFVHLIAGPAWRLFILADRNMETSRPRRSFSAVPLGGSSSSTASKRSAHAAASSSSSSAEVHVFWSPKRAPRAPDGRRLQRALASFLMKGCRAAAGRVGSLCP